MRTQRCAYCDWKPGVSPEGFIANHYKGSELCLGSNFVASRMALLVGDIAELKLDALGAKMTVCGICGVRTELRTAHRHRGSWIGDECCWDERLRVTE